MLAGTDGIRARDRDKKKLLQAMPMFTWSQAAYPLISRKKIVAAGVVAYVNAPTYLALYGNAQHSSSVLRRTTCPEYL